MTGPAVNSPRAKRTKSPEAMLASLMRRDSNYNSDKRLLARVFSNAAVVRVVEHNRCFDLSPFQLAIVRDALRYQESGLD